MSTIKKTNKSIIRTTVIGEGKNGCVHRPSLKCRKTQKHINYKNKLSKLMKTKEANIELEEYDLMEKIDKKHKLYLGKPEKCSPENSYENRKYVEQCDLFKPESLLHHSLLIMKYGGLHLKNFADSIRDTPNKKENPEIMRNFWKEARRLFIGLVIFHKNQVIHHDLKPQNIVYSVENNRINFIDFGTMITQSKLKKMCIASTYYFSLTHWSFPPEMKFVNRKNYKLLPMLIVENAIIIVIF